MTPELRSLMSEPTTLTTVPSFCSSSEKYFCKERSVNTERTREKDSLWLLLLSCFSHVMLSSEPAVFHPHTAIAHSSTNDWYLLAPLEKSVLRHGPIMAMWLPLLWGFWELSLRSQNANSKPGLGLSFQKVPCIALILLSVITLYWLGM